MEVLRQPIENETVTLSRAGVTLTYPCSVMLVAAMNPCPCGYFGHPSRPCTCSPAGVSRYLSRVSGPLLDRIDLHIEVPPVEFDQLSASGSEEPSAAIQQRVERARAVPKTSSLPRRLQRKNLTGASEGRLPDDRKRPAPFKAFL